MSDFTLPAWIGLVDAAGVLAALGLWLLVVDERWSFLRAAAGVTGVVLLTFYVAQRVGGLYSLSFTLTAPFFGQDGSGDVLLSILELAAGAAVGLFAATHGPGADEIPEDEEPAPEVEEREPAYVAPARAWSSTEVLGDAPHHDGDPPPPPPEPRLRVGPLLSRGVAAPLLSVAVALALPLGSLVQAFPVDRAEAAPRPSHYLFHALTGLLVGGALLGATIWLDLWERSLVVAAFALLAVGAGMDAAWPDVFRNEHWVFFGGGLAAGLLAAGLVRVLRRLRAPGRLSLIAGGAVALVLVAALGWANARVVYDDRDVFNSSSFEDDSG